MYIPLPKFKKYTGQPVQWMQLKLDGHFANIVAAKDTGVFSKNHKDITNKAKSCPNVQKVLDKIPGSSIVFGELWSKHHKATSVPTLLNEGSKDLQLTLFATPLFATRNLFNKPLPLISEIVEDAGIPFVPVSIIKDGVDIPALLRNAEEQGAEGWVLKNHHMKEWYKLKPTATVDAFIIGVSTSFSANHYGDIQGFQVAVWKGSSIKILADVGSGFPEEWRKKPKSWFLNKVCEIEADKELAAGGRLKFPRFVRWRPDKDAKDCTWEQIDEYFR